MICILMLEVISRVMKSLQITTLASPAHWQVNILTELYPTNMYVSGWLQLTKTGHIRNHIELLRKSNVQDFLPSSKNSLLATRFTTAGIAIEYRCYIFPLFIVISCLFLFFPGLSYFRVHPI